MKRLERVKSKLGKLKSPGETYILSSAKNLAKRYVCFPLVLWSFVKCPKITKHRVRQFFLDASAYMVS